MPPRGLSMLRVHVGSLDDDTHVSSVFFVSSCTINTQGLCSSSSSAVSRYEFVNSRDVHADKRSEELLVVSSVESAFLASEMDRMMSCWWTDPVKLSLWTLFVKVFRIWFDSRYRLRHRLCRPSQFSGKTRLCLEKPLTILAALLLGH